MIKVQQALEEVRGFKAILNKVYKYLKLRQILEIS